MSEEELSLALKQKKRNGREHRAEGNDLGNIMTKNNTQNLAMYLDLGLSQKKYQKLIAHGKKLASEVKFSPYSDIQAAKQE